RRPAPYSRSAGPTARSSPPSDAGRGGPDPPPHPAPTPRGRPHLPREEGLTPTPRGRPHPHPLHAESRISPREKSCSRRLWVGAPGGCGVGGTLRLWGWGPRRLWGWRHPAVLGLGVTPCVGDSAGATGRGGGGGSWRRR